EILDDVRPVYLGPPLGDRDVSLARKRLAPQEKIGSSPPFVLVVVASWLSWLGLSRGSRLSYQLLADLVQADQRVQPGIGPGADAEDVLHPPDEFAVRLRRDHPTLREPGFELVLLEYLADGFVRDPVDVAQLDQLVGQ